MNAKLIAFESVFERQKNKLIESGALNAEQIDETISLYLQNKTDPRLKYHKIVCKKDKCRRSIAVMHTNQSYKILFSEQPEMTVFVFIGHHSRYDRINQNC
ncbi:MAG: hypothetical protein JU82_06270 [Sulfuricurvum sp. MLSB]|uniref:hypothetical protein n=1 Tax=unclassified Sulfuricurvum TaxID=2632390 RepID=UPI0005044248|nr:MULTISPECIES: hypothetical protein [unclassified Sulfuricurvum]KFN39687.1 MAG: hypothetical protein JU82_06270 [Sulfuricurvum sp. MLSB]